MNLLKEFYYEEDGMGTIEVIVIIAILLSIALLFKKSLTSFATTLLSKVFPSSVDGIVPSYTP